MTAALSALPPAQRRLIAVALPESEAEKKRWIDKLKLDRGDGAAAAAGVMLASGTAIGAPIVVPVLAAIGIKRWLFGSKDEVRVKGLPNRVLKVKLDELNEGVHFPPGNPYPGAVYALNPVKPKVYMPLADFHRVTLREKAAELFKLLAGLRTASAQIAVERGVVRSGKLGLSALIPADVPVQVSGGGGSSTAAGTGIAYDVKFFADGAPRVPDDLQWLEHEPEWQAIASGRLDHGLKQFNVALRYADSLGVDASLALEIEDAGYSLGGSFQAFEEETWTVSGEFASKPMFGW